MGNCTLVIGFLFCIVFILIGVLTYMTQRQIQCLVEEVLKLNYDIQELRKRVVK